MPGDGEMTLGEVLAFLCQGREPEKTNTGRRLLALGQWPPDVFAFTSTVFDLSGCYRLVLSPPGSHSWPPSSSWLSFVLKLGEQWRTSIVESAPLSLDLAEAPHRLPGELRQALRKVALHADTPLAFLREEQAWPLLTLLATLHAAADQACVGAGIPVRPAAGKLRKASGVQSQGSLFLSERGTLSRLSTSRVRVLPKMRTPQVGATLRSLSHHLAIDRTEVEVDCVRNSFVRGEEERLNLLVLPWPRKVSPRDFCATQPRLDGRAQRFEFTPQERFDAESFAAAVRAAHQQFGSVDGVVLPEGAIERADLETIRALYEEPEASNGEPQGLTAQCGVRMLLAGVRGERLNYAHLAIHDESGWHTYDQPKHHRWRIDARQISQYHMGSALHPASHWWENIHIERRKLTLLFANGWLAMSHLICEDLARAGPGLDLVRSVGPTLLIALLLDGPQLASRWPARYATVLAEDPGTSVLTVSSLGMVELCRPDGLPRSRVVALWKDSIGGLRELSLDAGATGLLLTLTASRTREFTADGRDDGGTAAVLELTGVGQVVAQEHTRRAAEGRLDARGKQPEREARAPTRS